jgi:hypothetical protein
MQNRARFVLATSTLPSTGKTSTSHISRALPSMASSHKAPGVRARQTHSINVIVAKVAQEIQYLFAHHPLLTMRLVHVTYDRALIGSESLE